MNFMQGFKSAILAKLKNSQNGTLDPVHEIWNLFWPRALFWCIMKMEIRKIPITCPRVRQIQDLCIKKYKKCRIILRVLRCFFQLAFISCQLVIKWWWVMDFSHSVRNSITKLIIVSTHLFNQEINLTGLSDCSVFVSWLPKELKIA